MWNILFDKGILTAAVVLTIIGLTIKHRTGTSNELICLVLTILSIVIWSIIGAVTSIETGFVGILLSYGVKCGVLSAGLSVFVWDLIHGTYKYYRKDSKEKKEKE